MNTIQLEKVLSSNVCTSKSFGGIYNNMTLPMIYNQGKFYIVNTSTNPSEMGHWVLFIFHNNILYFIDSLGIDCNVYGGKIHSFFKNYNGYKNILMKKQYQSSTSLVCGAYVVYFSFMICKDKHPNKILLQFDFRKRKQNDKKVEKFLYSFAGIKLFCKKSLCPKQMFGYECRKVCFC